MLSDSVPGPDPRVRLMLGGDVMLGRLVGKAIQRFGPHYPLSGVAPLMSKADLTIVNLECAITSSTREWHGAPKAFYFGAPPAAVHALTDAGVDLVSLANNHALDYDVEGLLDTMKYLRARGIGWAGAGNSIDEARAPVFAERNGLRFGMAALCDHQVDFAAGVRRPGTTYVDLDDEPAALALMRKLLEPIQQAKADWPILSLHWARTWCPSLRASSGASRTPPSTWAGGYCSGTARMSSMASSCTGLPDRVCGGRPGR
nr:CapA family protein [Massilia cavernae]